MARTVSGGFNPLSLPGLLWLLHPDDATDIVSSEINSCPERVDAKSFAAAAAGNRMLRDFNSERPGHVAAKSSTGGVDWIRCADATLADSISGACTLFSFQRLVTPAGTTVLCSHNNSGSGPGFTTRHIALSYSSSQAVFSTRDAAGTTSYAWGIGDGFVLTSGWERWAVTLSGSGNAILYINGVSLGQKSGTLRSPTGMTHVHYGPALGESYHSVAGACAGVLSAGNIAALHAWMLSAA